MSWSAIVQASLPQRLPVLLRVAVLQDLTEDESIAFDVASVLTRGAQLLTRPTRLR